MLKQTNINIISKLCSGKINKTRYDDLGKPMKQTSFTVKNMRGNLSEKQFTIIKRNFRSSIKLLSLDSTISVDELTAETFYRFRTFEPFNIWTPSFLCRSQYVTNQRCTAPSFVTNTPTRRRLLATKFFTLSTMKIKKYLVTKS